MTFLTDGTAVKFTGIDHTFNVYSTFVEFNIGSSVFSVKFYGLIIAFGFLLAVLFGGRMAYKWKMDLNKMLDVLLYGTIGGIIGARLYYVAFEWDYYSQNLSEIPKIWNGGLAIYGGLIGGIIAAAITCKVDKMDFLKLLDLAGMSFLIGQGMGQLCKSRGVRYKYDNAVGHDKLQGCRLHSVKSGSVQGKGHRDVSECSRSPDVPV